MTPEQRETVANAAAMLDGMALELRMAHGIPPERNIIPEPEVAAEYFRIKRVVAELYEISKEAA